MKGRPAGSFNRATLARSAEMKTRYEAGETLANIAKDYGISAEAVRGVLTRHFGINRDCGGARVAAQKRAVDKIYRREKAREARFRAKWGCSWEQWDALFSCGAVFAYRVQKRGARVRGIGWELTLLQWWDIWQRSGRWNDRGTGHNKYVMGRHGDTGPYAVGNVSIIPYTQNISDGTRKADLPMGVQRRKSGKYNARCMIKGVKHHIGVFETPDEAHQAYLQYITHNTQGLQ